MPVQNPFMRQLGLIHPILQAPLAGGGDTPELVAAVGEAGGLGFIGAAYLTPQQISETSQAVGVRTAKRFGINLFAPPPETPPFPEQEAALALIAPFYKELELPLPSLPGSADNTFPGQLAAALESGASAFSFTFGVL